MQYKLEHDLSRKNHIQFSSYSRIPFPFFNGSENLMLFILYH